MPLSTEKARELAKRSAEVRRRKRSVPNPADTVTIAQNQSVAELAGIAPPSGSLAIRRLSPAWASGYLETIPAEACSHLPLPEYLRQVWGGGTYRITATADTQKWDRLEMVAGAPLDGAGGLARPVSAPLPPAPSAPPSAPAAVPSANIAEALARLTAEMESFRARLESAPSPVDAAIVELRNLKDRATSIREALHGFADTATPNPADDDDDDSDDDDDDGDDGAHRGLRRAADRLGDRFMDAIADKVLPRSPTPPPREAAARTTPATETDADDW